MATLRKVALTSDGSNPDSGTYATAYSSLTAAEAGEQDDLTVSDVQLDIACFAFTDTSSGWESEAAWTTDATRYVHLYAAAGAEASAVWDSGGYLLNPDNTITYALRMPEYSLIEHIQVLRGLRYAAYMLPGVTIDGCHFKGETGTSTYSAVRMWSSSGDVATIANTVISGPWSSAIDATQYQSPSSIYRVVQNVTVVGADKGVNAGGRNVLVQNVAAYGCSTAAFYQVVNLATGSDYNASDDATAPGANSLTSISDPFVDLAGEDYHLAAGSALIGAGADLSADFTTDIDGDTIVNWSIGADDGPAGGTTVDTTPATQSQTAEAVGLTQHNALSITGASQAQASPVADLTQHNAMVLSPASQSQTAASMALTQHNVLAPTEAAQAQVVGIGAFTQHGLFGPVPAFHAQTAAPLVLTQHHALTVTPAFQAQLAAAVSVVTGGTMSITAAGQAQTSGALVLTQHGLLTISAALQAQVAGVVGLTQHSAMTLTEAFHAQLASSVTMTLGQTVPVGALQGQSSVVVDLTQHGIIVVSGASQTQLAAVVFVVVTVTEVGGAEYSSQHASALAQIMRKGVAVTFTQTLPGTHDPAHDTWSAPSTSTVTGYAVRVQPRSSLDVERYSALGLKPSDAPMLLFAPDIYGDTPELGATVSWAGVACVVRDVTLVAPDATAILAKVVVEGPAVAGIAGELLYHPQHASALALLGRKGSPVTFTTNVPGTHDPMADTWSGPTTSTIAGYAVQVQPRSAQDVEKYRQLSLVPSDAPTLEFVPIVYGETPPLDATIDWGGSTLTVRDIQPVGPDGTSILLKVVVSK